jgi:hypothetical protein
MTSATLLTWERSDYVPRGSTEPRECYVASTPRGVYTVVKRDRISWASSYRSGRDSYDLGGGYTHEEAQERCAIHERNVLLRGRMAS